jgi:hypothetical protein
MKLAAFSLLIVVAMSGCAFRYTDARGRENVVGFCWVTYSNSAAQKPLILQVRTAGFGVHAGSKGTGLQLGYKETVEVVPPPEDKVLRIRYYPGASFKAEVEETPAK